MLFAQIKAREGEIFSLKNATILFSRLHCDMLQVIPRAALRTALKQIFNGLKLSIEEEEMLPIKSNNSRRVSYA